MRQCPHAPFWFPDEVWRTILSYCGHTLRDRIMRAEMLVNHHSSMPYVFSIHRLKGLDVTIQYLKGDHVWVFRVLGEDRIYEIVRATILREEEDW